MTTGEYAKAVKDILECQRSPARDMQDGTILARKLGVTAGNQEEQRSSLIAALEQVMRQEVQHQREHQLSSEQLETYASMSSEQRLVRDVHDGNVHLQSMSITLAYYAEGIAKQRIADICAIALRTIDHRIKRACDLLASRITEPSFMRPQTSDHAQRSTNPEQQSPRLTVHTLKTDLVGRGQFSPVRGLELSDKVKHYAEGFDFLGIKWTSVFAFTVAVVRADTLSETEVKTICKRFADFNDALENEPKSLGIPWYVYHLAFTMSGVLCLVYETKTLPEELQTELEQRPGPAYDKGIGKFIWFQTRATTLYWVVDAPTRQLYKHLGKQPDGTNMHARWTEQYSKELEGLINRHL